RGRALRAGAGCTPPSGDAAVVTTTMAWRALWARFRTLPMVSDPFSPLWTWLRGDGRAPDPAVWGRQSCWSGAAIAAAARAHRGHHACMAQSHQRARVAAAFALVVAVAIWVVLANTR